MMLKIILSKYAASLLVQEIYGIICKVTKLRGNEMSVSAKNEAGVEDILCSIREVMSGNLNKSNPSQNKDPLTPFMQLKDTLVLTTALQDDGTIKDLSKKKETPMLRN